MKRIIKKIWKSYKEAMYLVYFPNYYNKINDNIYD